MPGRNLTANPSCYTDTANWLGGSALTRLTGLTGTPRTTGASMAITAGAYSTSMRVGGFSDTRKGVTITWVGWFRSSVARTYRFCTSTYTGTTFVATHGATDVALSANTWTQIRITNTVASGAANHTLKFLHVDIPSAGTAGTLSASSVRPDDGTNSTQTYADGDTPGWVWDGATGTSTSTESEGGSTDPPVTPTGTDGPATLGATYMLLNWEPGANTRYVYFEADPGDLILVYAAVDGDIGNLTKPVDNTSNAYPDQSRAVLTYSLVRSASTTGRAAYLYSVTPQPSKQNELYICGIAANPGYSWGFEVVRFQRARLGNSAVTQGTGVPSLAVTTTVADSTLAVFNVDTNRAGGVPTWRTAGNGALTDLSATNPAGLRYYSGYHARTGSVGAKTVGVTAPTGQAFSIIGAEVIGSTYPSSGLFQTF